MAPGCIATESGNPGQGAINTCLLQCKGNRSGGPTRIDEPLGSVEFFVPEVCSSRVHDHHDYDSVPSWRHGREMSQGHPRCQTRTNTVQPRRLGQPPNWRDNLRKRNEPQIAGGLDWQATPATLYSTNLQPRRKKRREGKKELLAKLYRPLT